VASAGQTTTPTPHHSTVFRTYALLDAQPTASKHCRHCEGEKGRKRNEAKDENQAKTVKKKQAGKCGRCRLKCCPLSTTIHQVKMYNKR